VITAQQAQELLNFSKASDPADGIRTAFAAFALPADAALLAAAPDLAATVIALTERLEKIREIAERDCSTGMNMTASKITADILKLLDDNGDQS
jgi:hypothetical protein